jgi:hypothetical protein
MFISMLLGGRIVYTGKDIHAAHALAREKGLKRNALRYVPHALSRSTERSGCRG